MSLDVNSPTEITIAQLFATSLFPKSCDQSCERVGSLHLLTALYVLFWFSGIKIYEMMIVTDSLFRKIMHSAKNSFGAHGLLTIWRTWVLQWFGAYGFCNGLAHMGFLMEI